MRNAAQSDSIPTALSKPAAIHGLQECTRPLAPAPAAQPITGVSPSKKPQAQASLIVWRKNGPLMPALSPRATAKVSTERPNPRASMVASDMGGQKGTACKEAEGRSTLFSRLAVCGMRSRFRHAVSRPLLQPVHAVIPSQLVHLER